MSRLAFVVCAPGSGASLLIDALSPASESFDVVETIEGLAPADRAWDSNRLTADDLTPARAAELERRLAGQRGLAHEPPGKSALRVPFLAAALPEARFVFLHRSPVAALADVLAGWRTGDAVTYPELPDWSGPPWSFALVPGWRELRGRPIPEVAAAQWATTTTVLLDDLAALDADRWCVVDHDALLADPVTELGRVAEFVDVPRTGAVVPRPSPPARDAGVSRRRDRAVHAVLPLVADADARARELFAAEPPAPAPPDGGFSSSHTASFPALLAELGSTVLVTTYQSGRLIALREDGGALNTHFRLFDSPMGLGVGPGRLVVGTRRQVWDYRDQPEAAARLVPAGKHDACYLPRSCHVTGDVRIHDVTLVGDEVWIVNTLFSCLASLDADHSFVPRWRPPFVSELAPEDRCHLNGLALVDGRPRYVTAFGTTDTAGDWRPGKASGGVVVDVESGDIVVRDLCMPHSPRWHDGGLWLLESGKGTLARADLERGAVTTIAELPGFTRGLAFAGPYAFVGLSQVRETLFEGVPIVERADRACGVWVVDVRTGSTVALLRFEGAVQEIFEVQLLAGVRYPEIAEPGDDLGLAAFVVPDEALADVPARLRGGPD